MPAGDLLVNLKQHGPMGIMVIDVGIHVLSKIPGSHLLVQVTVPTLEERARSQNPIKTLMLQPGMPHHRSGPMLGLWTRTLPDVCSMMAYTSCW